MAGALDGIRVLELARYQAGPRGGMILSDLGAEVIKIEKLGGEETRKSEPMVRGQSVYFTVYNRGKKSVCLDMRTERGKEVFAANCASCHGENGAGKTDFGAPDLTDAFWIYGGDAQSVFSTVWNGRQGHMPTWETRLSALDRKILALYLVDLRKPGQ